MSSIEFHAKVRDGLIRVPRGYKRATDSRRVKVSLVVQEKKPVPASPGSSLRGVLALYADRRLAKKEAGAWTAAAKTKHAHR